ncbi:MAG: hypothetical protein J3K34DRAFT_525819 [Monoraphidium minutum]|nr:MAG: hypothetical protein J3K34DRAFT_525819 [Monoraphidium minutum]
MVSQDGGGGAAAAAPAAPPLVAADCYKKTAVGDYVVRRHVRLYPDHFTTYRDAGLDPAESREYGLGPGVTLVPPEPGQIGKRTRRVRPEGVGHLTALAAAAGKGREIDLHSFKLEWDSWHHFHFGFESLDAAKEFHRAITAAVDRLRASAGLPPAAAPPAAPAPAGAAAAAALAGAAPGGGGGGGGLGHPPLTSSDSVPMIVTPPPTAAGRSPLAVRFLCSDSVPMIVTPPPTAAGRSPLAAHPIGMQGSLDEAASDDEDGELAALWHTTPGDTTSPAAGKRWVPYRRVLHTNGIAIYKHCGRAASSRGGGAQTGPDGDEYMVSAVVRGRPSEALRVLLDPASATTILGPAREVEVLEAGGRGRQALRVLLDPASATTILGPAREVEVLEAGGRGRQVEVLEAGGRGRQALRVLLDPASATTILGPAREVEVLEAGGRGRQVLRIVVQAGGVVGGRLAAREAVVSRVLRRESAGIYVLLFSSVDNEEERAAFEGQGAGGGEGV